MSDDLPRMAPSPDSGDGLFKNLVRLTGASVIVRIGGAIAGILILRILGPHAVGIWRAVEIAVVYLSAVSFGVSYSTERLLPQFSAERKPESARSAHDFLFGWTLLEGLLVGGAVLAFLAIFRGRYPGELGASLLWVPPLLIVHKMVANHVMVLRAQQHFAAYAKAQTVLAGLDWTLLGWAYAGKLQGVLVGAFVIGLVKLIYLTALQWRLGHSRLRWSFSPSTLRLHWPYGPGYALFKAVWILGERIDAAFVGYLLGTSALAFYYLGFQMTALALEIPIALIYVAFPELMRAFANTEKPGAFSERFFHYLNVQLFLVVPFVTPLAYFGSVYLIHQMLPAFVPAVPVVKILLLGVGLLAVKHLYYQVLMAHGRVHHLSLLAGLSSVTFFVVFGLVRPWLGVSIVSAAIAKLVANAAHLVFLLLATGRLTNRDGIGIRRSLGLDIGVLAGWALLVLVVDLFLPGNGTLDLWRLFLQILVCWTISLALIFLRLPMLRGAQLLVKIRSYHRM